MVIKLNGGIPPSRFEGPSSDGITYHLRYEQLGSTLRGHIMGVSLIRIQKREAYIHTHTQQ